MNEARTELVLGIPRDLVPGGLGWRGVRGVPIEPFLDAARDHGEFRPRAEAEADPSWKQIIPYLLLRDGERIFLMRRTRAGGDERLHDRYTIGIGGHVNPEDADVDRRPAARVGGGDRSRLRARVPSDRRAERRRQRGRRGPPGAGLQRRRRKSAGGDPGDATSSREPSHRSDDVAAVADKLETWSALLFEFLRTIQADNQRLQMNRHIGRSKARLARTSCCSASA